MVELGNASLGKSLGILVDNFLCIIDATITILMVITNSELGHYYLANKNTFPCFSPV